MFWGGIDIEERAGQPLKALGRMLAREGGRVMEERLHPLKASSSMVNRTEPASKDR